MLNDILKGDVPSKKVIPVSNSSILKGISTVNPHELGPSEQKDFSILKLIVLLIGLPVQDMDEYISKVWGQFLEIKNLNSFVHCTVFILFIILQNYSYCLNQIFN
jgi:hypothetical protein